MLIRIVLLAVKSFTISLDQAMRCYLKRSDLISQLNSLLPSLFVILNALLVWF